MKLTLLGTGTPIADINRRGPAQIVESGGELVLIDCGAGALHRLVESGNAFKPIKRIAFTHLHSDHITGLADILWAGWIRRWWEVAPVVAGPPGTQHFISKLIEAFEYDIAVRNRGESNRSERLIPVVEEVEEGWQAEGSDWRLSAFRVDHEPVDQAFGYRIESGDGSIVFSGDTCYNENLIEKSHGADLLVHEVYWGRGLRDVLAKLTDPVMIHRQTTINGYHTPSDELGKIASLAEVKHVAMSHILAAGAKDSDLIDDVAAGYKGKVTVGADLQVFDL